MHIILILILLFQPALKQQVTENDFIAWSKNRPLSWDDFLAPVNPNSKAVATTSTQISLEFSRKNNKIGYTITCLFAKKKSWVLVKNDHILKHEQGHFDIAEIYARKLHKVLGNHISHFPGNMNELNVLYEKTMQEKDAFQERYDRETNFSINKEKQAEWSVKIETLLNDLNEYADYHQNKP